MLSVGMFRALLLMLTGVLCTVSVGCGRVLEQDTAACAVTRPTLEAEPARAAPEGSFGLRGAGFYGDFVCNDTDPPERPGEPSGPIPDDSVEIQLVQGERTWDLATVASDKDLDFETDLEVPASAQPGRATVRATGSNIGSAGGMRAPVETTFTVLDAPLPSTGGPMDQGSAP